MLFLVSLLLIVPLFLRAPPRQRGGRGLGWTASPRPAQALQHAILVAATLVALAPTVFMLLTSLKSQEEYTFNKVGLPRRLVLDHYRRVLFESSFLAWMGNSVILAAGAVALSTVGLLPRRLRHRADASFAGRRPAVLDQHRADGRAAGRDDRAALRALHAAVGLISTYQGAILIYAGLITPFSVYLLTSFFRTLPSELFDAARIDGAGDLLILWKIVLPLSLPRRC